MNLNNGDGPSFVKVLTTDSVDYLPLPEPFAKKYFAKRNINNQTVFLKSNYGDHKWRVKYASIEDRYYFMDGWLRFMNDNRLQINDFLVFTHLTRSKNTMFKVSMYAPNGCLKQPTSLDEKKTLVRKLKEQTSENVHKSFRHVFKKSYNYKMPIMKKFIEDTGISGYDTVQLRNNEGKIIEVKVKTGSYCPLMTSGWSEFRKLINVKVGNTCEFTHVESNLIHVRVLKMKGGPTRVD